MTSRAGNQNNLQVKGSGNPASQPATASSSEMPIPLRFGAELEVVTGSKKNKHKDWLPLAKELSAELTQNGVNNHVNSKHDRSAENYSEWSIVDEKSIQNNPTGNQWGMELVSPVLDYQKMNLWPGQFDRVWSVLANSFSTSSTNQCSTHVHFSPRGAPWTLSQIQSIAKSVLYYERAIDSIMPFERRTNAWARSNRHNVLFLKEDMATLFHWIDSCTSLSQVAFYMCAFDKDSDYGRMDKATEHFPHFVFRWNFTPLVEGTTGTIEFRQPPGSFKASDTKTWVNFGAAFINAAVNHADKLAPTQKADLKGFKIFLERGAWLAGLRSPGYFDHLFAQRPMLPDGEIELNQAGIAHYMEVFKKAKQGSITQAKFKKLQQRVYK
ncbi:hypothetical protein M011DRAFT_456630 [Sporormia fimetaria CBS 119925]|uniref:Amidoligase enzyme n=1 Tax=Sporormia fimetaria CBS 119925 TaxID=1340428 RepID=A0A6A6VH08_9PLEO|nr:hypothetical protein M011DRAFT_456630 [Sporormia fimetaria CBS 119925]